MLSVLQTGQVFKLLTSSHSSQIQTCPQLQNKTLGKLVRHITHSSDLNVSSVLIVFKGVSCGDSKGDIRLLTVSSS